jgi:hypothetical protein
VRSSCRRGRRVWARSDGFVNCTVSLIQALFVRIATRAIVQSRSMIALAMSHRSVAMESGT